ncbi:hypothetical protein [Rhodococcoides fascians]|uniref:hypothetical protein n=1 Tax=Rhodococcoides fascians TaxID=1828 RepID=UPI00050CF973|nr:hypothetical protein [Rhodococcus fascians]
MSITDAIGDYISMNYPRTPHYVLPRLQGPIWAAISASGGYSSMLILEDSRDRSQVVGSIQVVVDLYRGRMRQCGSDTRVDFPRVDGELLIRTPYGRQITRRFDQIFTLASGPLELPQ